MAASLDEDLAWGVIRARSARDAARAFNGKDVKMSESQSATYKRMLDALDARDRALGIPEEL